MDSLAYERITNKLVHFVDMHLLMLSLRSVRLLLVFEKWFLRNLKPLNYFEVKCLFYLVLVLIEVDLISFPLTLICLYLMWLIRSPEKFIDGILLELISRKLLKMLEVV